MSEQMSEQLSHLVPRESDTMPERSQSLPPRENDTMSEQLSHPVRVLRESDTISEQPPHLPPQENDTMSKQLVASEPQVAESAEDAPVHDKFTLFPKLPPEIRRMIFSSMENVCVPTRFLNVGPYRCAYGEESPPLTIATNNLGDTKRTAPLTTMAISKEARAEALRTNVKWSFMTASLLFIDGHFIGESYSLHSSPMDWAYINPRKDVFFFGSFDRRLNEYGLENAAANFASADHAIVAFGKVQHLALSLRTIIGDTTLELRMFLAYLSNFSMLKDLTIIIPEESCVFTPPIHKCSCLESLETTFALKLSGIVQRYLTRRFQNSVGKDSELKLPVIKCLFHSTHIFLLRIYEEFKSKECWEKEWDKMLKENWEEFLPVFEELGPGETARD